MTPVEFSVVIPSLHEGEVLLGAIRNARGAIPGAEIVVVAFSEDDPTRAACCAEGVTWIAAPRASRGHQLALGASRARGATLVFLHADTRLPAGAAGMVRRALAAPDVVGGAFRLRFDVRHPLLDGLGVLTRSSAMISILGDQGMFCSRWAYERAGGFDPIAQFEDVALAGRLATIGRLARIPTPVVSSARRFGRHGILRLIAHNTLLLARYHTIGLDARVAERTASFEEPA